MKLFLGDCFDILNNNDIVADVAFTSPPYNRKRNDKYTNYDDIINDYYTFLVNVTNKLLRVCQKYVIINLQTNYYNKKDVYKYIGHYANDIQNIIIWEKSNPMPANGHNITNAYEMFIVLGNESLKGNFTYTKNHITTSVNGNITKIHKAVMKQEVSDWFIVNFTKGADVIIDPFMGLGTTGISCIKNNRKFIGIEIDETYFNIAKDRIDGNNAIHSPEVRARVAEKIKR